MTTTTPTQECVSFGSWKGVAGAALIYGTLWWNQGLPSVFRMHRNREVCQAVRTCPLRQGGAQREVHCVVAPIFWYNTAPAGDWSGSRTSRFLTIFVGHINIQQFEIHVCCKTVANYSLRPTTPSLWGCIICKVAEWIMNSLLHPDDASPLCILFQGTWQGHSCLLEVLTFSSF